MSGPAPLGEILRLAAPTVFVTFVQAIAQTTEAALIGRLGTEALAGYALVLPLLMLMQMTSGGAMGGGVTSAVARAIGAGRMDEAAALVAHGLVIAAGMGVLTSLLVLGFGPALFRAVGGTGPAFDHAVSYAAIVFGGAVLVWVANILGAVLRGAGKMRLPAYVMTICWVVEAPLSGLFMLGFGWGLPGAAAAYLIAFALAAGSMGFIILRGGAGFRPRLLAPLRRELFRRILSVGLVATVMATIANLTVVLMTALVARHGTAAIAAYGVGVRLEFLMIPIGFGIGVALTSLVGRQVGAGDWAGARATAWRGGLLAAALCGVIGIAAALLPGPLSRVFASDPEVREALVVYLRWVGPSFGPFGLGMALYFACQGAGRMRWPFAGSVARLGVAVGGGWLLAAFGGAGLAGSFAAIAAGLAAYGAIIASSVRPGVWR